MVKSLEEKNKSIDDTSTNYAKLANLSVEIALFSTVSATATFQNTSLRDFEGSIESRGLLGEHDASRSTKESGV